MRKQKMTTDGSKTTSFKEFFALREHYIIPCLHCGFSRDFEIEELYQHFKTRMLAELAIKGD